MRSRYLGGLRLFYLARKSSSASLFIRISTRCLTQKYFDGHSELTKAIGQAVNQLRLSGNMSGNGQNVQSKKGRRRSKSPKSPRKRTSENHGPKPPSPNHRTLGVNYTEYKEMFYIIFYSLIYNVSSTVLKLFYWIIRCTFFLTGWSIH